MYRYLKEILQDKEVRVIKEWEIDGKCQGYKSELSKKVEYLEKDEMEIKNKLKEMTELLRGKFINNHFVEEEVVVHIEYMNVGVPKIMLIDSRAPKSEVSREEIEGYLRDLKIGWRINRKEELL